MRIGRGVDLMQPEDAVGARLHLVETGGVAPAFGLRRIGERDGDEAVETL
jgi:hypothetical protein